MVTEIHRKSKDLSLMSLSSTRLKFFHWSRQVISFIHNQRTVCYLFATRDPKLWVPCCHANNCADRRRCLLTVNCEWQCLSDRTSPTECASQACSLSLYLSSFLFSSSANLTNKFKYVCSKNVPLFFLFFLLTSNSSLSSSYPPPFLTSCSSPAHPFTRLICNNAQNPTAYKLNGTSEQS